MTSPSSPRRSQHSRSSSHRSTLTAQRTEVKINIYDLLPPSKLSSVLWIFGTSLLHSGVVLGNREYAYGGHDRPNTTGVYYTRPGQLPPGGTFRCTLLHGFIFLSRAEIDDVIRDASLKFQGTRYHLLSQNCNHFTSYLVEKLTKRPAPAWLNRAAGIGLALPCVVPREWISPPEFESQDGELVNEEDDDERTAILRRQSNNMRAKVSEDEQLRWEEEMDQVSIRAGSSKTRSKCAEAPRTIILKDTGGREMLSTERAPLPSR